MIDRSAFKIFVGSNLPPMPISTIQRSIFSSLKIFIIAKARYWKKLSGISPLAAFTLSKDFKNKLSDIGSPFIFILSLIRIK